VLSVGAVMLSRTLLALVHAPLGYLTDGILVMYADAPAFQMPQYLEAIRTFEAALDEIRHITGVHSAAAVMGLPTGRYGSSGTYLVEGEHIQPGQDPFRSNWSRDLPEATFALASPQYFKTVGIPLLAGRDFTLRDQYTAPFTAIISRSLARQSFGSSNPIGRRIYCGLDSPKAMTIVGVVGDVKQKSPASKPEPEIYMPFQQHPFFANELQIAIRTDGNPTRLIPQVRKRMRRLAPLMATSFASFSEIVRDSVSVPRFRATLALVFAFLAATMATTGVYSLTAYSVSQRKAELGLRIALGATRIDIICLVFRQALLLAVAGLAIGVMAAIAVSRLVESLLYGVRALEIPTYSFGAGFVLIIVILASAVPAWRACRVDPSVTLRNN
jgi:putative ABC transport system permease protein